MWQKGSWKFLNFKHDCNFRSDYTVQEHFSSSCLEQEITFVDLENRNAVLVVAANAKFLNYWRSAFFSCTIFFSGSFLKATACLMITFIVLSTPLQLLTSLTLIYKNNCRNLDPEGRGSGLTRDVHSPLLPENIM